MKVFTMMKSRNNVFLDDSQHEDVTENDNTEYMKELIYTATPPSHTPSPTLPAS